MESLAPRPCLKEISDYKPSRHETSQEAHSDAEPDRVGEGAAESAFV